MEKPNTLLNKEALIVRPLMSCLLVGAISGCAILLNSSAVWWVQFNVLGHILVGIFFTVFCLPYLFQHFKRTLGVRRPLVMLSGCLAALFTLGFLYTGLFLATKGSLETERIYLELHRYGGLLLIGLLSLHIFLHRVIKSRKDGDRFHTLQTYTKGYAARAIVAYVLLIALATTLYSFNYQRPELESVTNQYLYDYGSHPFRPSQTETPAQNFVATNQISNSDNCGLCHSEIAKQWSSSAHRQAASDPAYVTNILLLEEKKGISATRYCEGCHAPIALLTGQLTPGGLHGGIENTIANKEGVSCLSCHRITHTVHLDGVASYHFAPAAEYLFQHSESNILKNINRYLTQVSSRQHREDMAQPVLSQPTHCATCHAQFMDKEMNDWGWVKMQDDYSAWLASPYSRQHQQNFSSESIERCQDCHMPLVAAATDPSANKEGKVRSHRFAAANTMLPFLNNDNEQLEATIAFLR